MREDRAGAEDGGIRKRHHRRPPLETASRVVPFVNVRMTKPPRVESGTREAPPSLPDGGASLLVDCVYAPADDNTLTWIRAAIGLRCQSLPVSSARRGALPAWKVKGIWYSLRADVDAITHESAPPDEG